jgi:hypothetical protein
MRSTSAFSQRSSLCSERTIASSIMASPSTICPVRPEAADIRNANKIIIEVFARGCKPRYRPTPAPTSMRIDTS